jgi:hypothetical protein
MADRSSSPTPAFAPGSIRGAVVRRATQAIERIAREADERKLAAALEAPTDVGTLARILGDAALLGPAAEIEPLAPAIAHGAELRSQLLDQAGGTLGAGQAAALLGVSRQAIDKRRRAHALLAVRQGGDWHYPRCQFAENDTVEGLPRVLKTLAHVSPWTALDFLLAPDSALGGVAPLEALRVGRREEVLRLARGLAEADGFA